MLAAALAVLQSVFCASAVEPQITSVAMDQKDIVVHVFVPVGVKKITLESRTRLGSGAWIPRSVLHLDSPKSEVEFRLPRSSQVEILRVRTDAEEALPKTFYEGTNVFVSGASASAPSVNQGPIDAAPGAGGAADGDSANGSGRTVAESDIWKIDGNTLYFFNQYRGLQVIDVTAPDAPLVTGTYPLPAAGEKMYVLDATHVLLLAQANCNANDTGSQALVLDVSGGVPKFAASLPVSGWIQESRMVGTALYVASQAYRQMQGAPNSAWEWGSVVTSFDFANPANPVAKDTFWYSGYGNVVTATEDYLFVVTQNPANWAQSTVHCIDVKSPDGAMKQLASIATAGQVPDKFKMNQNGDVLAVISENWNGGNRGVITVLETFSLANPVKPEKLGQLELGAGERLHASRFDRDRVYVVTFFRTDPLWIVDLTDPRAPHIAGELQVPGWSTYIEPWGDRLVTIGVNDTNDWRVAVSLFDVQDPSHPALLSKVPLGTNSSWSEANYDEKALAVLPDAGLILVPYEGYETNGYASRVQLIDLTASALTARGTIEHSFQPRRAALHGDRIYSISGKELLAVDASDRDKPVVRAELELSWSVDRVFIAGDYLLEVANGNNWYGWWSQNSATPPSVRIAPQANPDRPVGAFVLARSLPIIGAALREGKLYLLQGNSSGYGPIFAATAADKSESSTTNPASLFLSILDVSQAPTLSLIGEAEAPTDAFGWSASFTPVWPKPNLIVWSGGGGGLIPFLDGGPVQAAASDAAIGIAPWWRGGSGGKLFAFDVGTPAAPAFASELDLTTNAWWSFSSPFAANGSVYVSHQNSEFVEGVLLPGQQPPQAVVTIDKETGRFETNLPPVGIWVQRYFLDVVDYADEKAPTARPPVNIPGQLQGLGRTGAILYTVSPHWTNWTTDWSEWLDASAYDGASASLIDSLPLPKEWPHPIVVSNDRIFLARPDVSSATSQIESWILPDSGRFQKRGSLGLGETVNNLAANGNLLVAQQVSSVVLIDAADPAALAVAAKGGPQSCFWFDLASVQGSLSQGLWAPLGEYGLFHIEARK